MIKHQRLGLKKNFKKIIGVIGIGYVGLPLAINLSKYFKVISFDTNKKRVEELNRGIDRNLEFNKKQLSLKKIKYTNNYVDLKICNIFIITLPTPLNKKKPDISLVLEATKKLAGILKINDMVIYESTFYPGTVDDQLIPILEKFSKLKYKKDFFIGYSPERINPGDKVHTFKNVKKIISANDKNSLKIISYIYKKIVKAGVYKASSIKVAELSKILENTQRFINIALMNEISSLSNKMGLQTKEVIDVASTKWNFNKYYPGFVGGHCVAVDPLYLSHKQKSLNLSSSFIKIADKINSNKYLEVASKLKLAFKKISNKKILILGLTFKENCPDLRNSGTMDLVRALNNIKLKPDLHDPFVEKNELRNNFKYKFNFLKKIKRSNYDCIILSVAHDFYKNMKINKLKQISTKADCIIFDLKSIYKKEEVHYQL